MTEEGVERGSHLVGRDNTLWSKLSETESSGGGVLYDELHPLSVFLRPIRSISFPILKLIMRVHQSYK